MAVNPGPIDTAPDVPSRSDRATFVAKSEDWRDWEKVAFPQVSQAAEDTYTNALEAATKATEAAASATAAASASGATVWVSGTTYAIGDVRWSPITYRAYRRKTAGAGTTDPSADSTNWAETVPLIGSAVGAINFLKGSDVASATTPDIWAAGGNLLNITGTTTTTGFAAAPQAGAHRVLRAAGAWPLTHGANLILPGSANYTCSAGDVLFVHALTTTQFFVNIFRADGTPVVNAPLGWRLLSSATASSSASVSFASGIDSTYDEYVIEFINVVGASSAGLRARTSSNGGSSYDSGASDYLSILQYNTVSTPTPSGAAGTSDGFLSLHASTINNTASQGGLNGQLRLYAPSNASARKMMVGQFVLPSDASDEYQLSEMRGVRKSASAVNAIQFYMSTGNIASGTFKLYGVKK